MPELFDLNNLFARIDLSGATALLERGGPVVILIGLLSVVALAVGLAKLWQFVSCGVGGGRGVQPALQAWTIGDVERAAAHLTRRRNPTARVILHAMTTIPQGRPEAVVREDAERVALRALANLRQYLRVIEATAQVAPLLGLFGTVLGMMRAFQALQASGGGANPAELAGGIWVALITTAVGLAVAMPATLALYWFEGRIEREKTIMEDGLTQLLTSWQPPASGDGDVVPIRTTRTGSPSAAE
mgnify:CR=1 FL=1